MVEPIEGKALFYSKEFWIGIITLCLPAVADFLGVPVTSETSEVIYALGLILIVAVRKFSTSLPITSILPKKD